MPPDATRDALLIQLNRLERERDEVVNSLPAHSTPPTLLIRLEDLDDAIAALRAQISELPTDTADQGI